MTKTERTYPSRVRIANKTQWALKDMLGLARLSRGDMGALKRWMEAERLEAKGRFDTARLARIGDFDHVLCRLTLRVAELERLAADARIGEYCAPNQQLFIDS